MFIFFFVLLSGENGILNQAFV